MRPAPAARCTPSTANPSLLLCLLLRWSAGFLALPHSWCPAPRCWDQQMTCPRCSGCPRPPSPWLAANLCQILLLPTIVFRFHDAVQPSPSITRHPMVHGTWQGFRSWAEAASASLLAAAVHANGCCFKCCGSCSTECWTGEGVEAGLQRHLPCGCCLSGTSTVAEGGTRLRGFMTALQGTRLRGLMTALQFEFT